MKITLVNPPYLFATKLEYLTQNLGLGYLASFLIEDGHNVNVIDALAEGMDRSERVTIDGRKPLLVGLPFDEIAERIPSDSDLIGVTAPFSNHAPVIDALCAAVKKRLPEIPVVLGGVYASTQPERALESSSLDYAVVGEGENPIRSLARGEKPENVKGVWYRRDGKIIGGGRSEMIPDLDSIPFPARRLLPMRTYFKLSPRGRPNNPTATLITSRGCPFDCSFCSIHPVYQRKWRARSPENVLAEIDELISEWGVNDIEFEDDNLTLDVSRAKAIFSGLLKRRVQWACPNGLRVDALDAELLDLMRRSGCTAVHLAIESGDPDMLVAMNKKLDLKKVEEIVAVCHDKNIPMVGFFILGHPGETEKRFRNTMNFAGSLTDKGMVNCGAHIATPYPGTKLLKICEEKGYLIHKDVERRVMFPGDIHIETPDFSKRDVIHRLYRMRVAVGQLPRFKKSDRIFTWKIRPALSSLGITRRRYPADMSDKKLEGFYQPDSYFDDIRFRWTNGDGKIRIRVPRFIGHINIFASSNREHVSKIFLDDVQIAEMALADRWTIYYINLPEKHPTGKALLRFTSGTMVPAHTGFSEDERTLGMRVGWYVFY